MIRPRSRHPALALAVLSICLAAPRHSTARAQAPTPNEPNPSADPAVARAGFVPARSITVPGRSGGKGDPGRAADAGSGWWTGPVGIAAALAAVGALSLAAKRFGLDLNLGIGANAARGMAGRLGVVGTVRLGPKQAVHLVRVGDRVLIVGTGSAGGPVALGEVSDPAELARLIPHRQPAAPPARAATARPLARLDQRIGDDE